MDYGTDILYMLGKMEGYTKLILQSLFQGTVDSQKQ